MLYNMNRKVCSREFLHGFSKLQKKLQPGESVVVTRRGQPLGTFTKDGPARMLFPDFEKRASKPGFTNKIGDQLLARLLRDEEAIS
jgi:hypothetical protein